ncbi:MAG: TfoX/Sxy family protein [Ferruginibacter sp.]
MAYNEKLAGRVRTRFKEMANVEEKKMMGGLIFMVDDKMCVGIMKNELMCRVNPSLQNELLEREGCRQMDFIKRPGSGFILVNEETLKTKKEFEYFISLALEYNKMAKSSKRKKT